MPPSLAAGRRPVFARGQPSGARIDAAQGRWSRQVTDSQRQQAGVRPMHPPSKPRPDGKRAIAGTPVFDGDAAIAGYALNAMCYSFNSSANRAAFLADEEGYMGRF